VKSPPQDNLGSAPPVTVAALMARKLVDIEMGDFPIERIRNFSIVAHIGSALHDLSVSFL
jgi:hypothetical protein